MQPPRAPVMLVQLRPPECVEASESRLPLAEKCFSESTHPSPYADWDDASNGEKVADKQPIAPGTSIP